MTLEQWNSLPDDVRKTPSVSHFIATLKTHLFLNWFCFIAGFCCISLFNSDPAHWDVFPMFMRFIRLFCTCILRWRSLKKEASLLRRRLDVEDASKKQLRQRCFIRFKESSKGSKKTWRRLCKKSWRVPIRTRRTRTEFRRLFKDRRSLKEEDNSKTKYFQEETFIL